MGWVILIRHSSWEALKERRTKSVGGDRIRYIAELVWGGGGGQNTLADSVRRTNNASGLGPPGPIIARIDLTVTQVS